MQTVRLISQEKTIWGQRFEVISMWCESSCGLAHLNSSHFDLSMSGSIPFTPDQSIPFTPELLLEAKKGIASRLYYAMEPGEAQLQGMVSKQGKI